MAKQGKDGKELRFPEMLKSFFGISKSVTPAQQHRQDSLLTPELFKDIGRESPTGSRLKAIKQLTEDIAGRRLEDYGIENVWFHVEDLFVPEQPRVNRLILLNLLKCITHTQFEWLQSNMRTQIFRAVKEHDVPEDLVDRIEILDMLTKTGREVNDFEHHIGRFLARLMPESLKTSKAVDVLKIHANLIKFNSAFIDEDTIEFVVIVTCEHALTTKLAEGVELSLEVLEGAIGYSYLPSKTLHFIIPTLCQTVNVEKFFKSSLKLVHNLLGTKIGCSALYTLCGILQFRENLTDVQLVRGAVFFIGMALWGNQKITSLKFSPCVALPFFLRALSTKNLLVASEICVSLQRLVVKHGSELHQTIWDFVMDLLQALLVISEDREIASRGHCPEPASRFVGPREEMEELPARKLAEFPMTQADIANYVHEIINKIEQLYDEKKYKGCEERFFAILDKNAARRPESSVLRLITFRTQSIHPLNANWLFSLNALVERFYKQEGNTVIRVKMIDAISFVIAANRSIYEDDITEKIVLPVVSHIESESDPTVRNRAVELLVDTALDCSSKICVDILDILERVILHPFDPIHLCGGRIDSQDAVHIVDENAIVDVKTAVTGLIELFWMKFYMMPTTLPLSVFKILIAHLQAQYHCSPTGTQTSNLRAQVFDNLMRIRSHTDRRLGLLDSNTGAIRYSSYIFCSTGLPMSSLSPLPMSPNPFTFPQVHPCYFSVEPLFQVITVCLKQEKDWSVLKTVLTGLTRLLRDKLLVSGCSSISVLCSSVCGLVSDRNLRLPDTLRNIPADFQRSDFSLAVLQVIAGLVSYHKFFDSNLQKLLVKCLQCGLSTKSSRVCILNLTVAILEMPDTLFKTLPDVLLALSKISATVAIAIPVLEFLSTLICLPKLFASFIQDQYMSIFAIALPYTNPFKFNHYVVSLAHHVIAMWFLKCKLPFRKGFVKFIMKSLKSNIVAPSGDITGQQQQQTSLADDDLATKGSRGGTSPSNEEVNAFHVELTETCVDLLARYTFASCSVLPKRTPLTEFLLSQGQKSTWLMGNTLVTVTTSGCASRSSRYGVCEKCASIFKSPSSSMEAPMDTVEPDLSGRRRHRSAVMRSLSGDQQDSVRRSQDDMLIKLGTLGKMSSGTMYESKTTSPSGMAASETRLCSCWYHGWAEILVRRPSGNISWVMRIENQLQLVQNADMPLAEIASLVEYGVPMVPPESESPLKGELSSEDPLSVSESPEIVSSQQTSAVASPLPASGAEASAPVISATTPRKQSDEDSFVLTDTPKKESPSPLMTRPARAAATLSLRKLSEEVTFPRSALDEDDPVVGGMWSTTSAPRVQSSDRRASMAAEKAVAASILHRSGGVDAFSAVRTSCPELKKSPPLSPSKAEGGDLQPIRRDRGHTISVMTPVAGKWTTSATGGDATTTGSLQRSSTLREIGQPTGVNPSFVFLQLYHNNCFGAQVEKPVLLPKTDAVERGIKNLDRIPPYETHKIGVVYVGPEQANNEAAILGNEYGSVRYMNFLSGLGRLIRLEEVDPQETYVGGLELTGNDGKFAYIWQDDVMQVIFHVATLMPSKANDPSCIQKKLHIGNDFVTIVYNDSRQEYDIHTIKGQFIYACVVIEPLDFESSLVTVKTKQELNELIGHSEPKIVMDTNAAVLVRQLALHSNLASMIIQRHQGSPKDPYASNWLERLRHIKRLKSKYPAATPQDEDSPPPAAASGRRKPQMDDFTTFV